MIVSITRVTGKPEKRTELLQTIRPLLQPIKSARGCLNLDFYIDAADENSFLLIGEWESEIDLAACSHFESSAVLRGALSVLSVLSVEQMAQIMAPSQREN